jgi:hypothetical protein
VRVRARAVGARSGINADPAGASTHGPTEHRFHSNICEQFPPRVSRAHSGVSQDCQTPFARQHSICPPSRATRGNAAGGA